MSAENPASDARRCPLCGEPVDPDGIAWAHWFEGLFAFKLRWVRPICWAADADQWIHAECLDAMAADPEPEP